MPSFRAIAAALTGAADAMERNASLDPDGAVRLVIWGTPDAHMPYDQTADSDLYDDVTSVIECYDADLHGYDPGNGIEKLSSADAIRAARAEAQRFCSYGR